MTKIITGRYSKYLMNHKSDLKEIFNNYRNVEIYDVDQIYKCENTVQAFLTLILEGKKYFFRKVVSQMALKEYWHTSINEHKGNAILEVISLFHNEMVRTSRQQTE